MQDIFINMHGNLLENWIKACPKASVDMTVKRLSVKDSVVFWLHSDINNQAWIEKTIAEIQKKRPSSKIVVLANAPSQAEAVAVISKGVVGYCHAYSPANVLKELKTVVMHGGVWLGRDLLQTLIGATKNLVHNASNKVDEALALLTKREKEVALHASVGLSNKEIARKLLITERTVKAHISSTLEKLGVKDRLQLALVLNGKSSDSAGSNKRKANKTAGKVKSSKSKKKSQPGRAKIKKT
ncbi:MAG: response regulator transcription factor [Methylophilaceae bacterium]